MPFLLAITAFLISTSAFSAPAPAPGFTDGIGKSFAECNGRAALGLYSSGKLMNQWAFTTAWVFGTDPVSGRGNKIFGYTRKSIEKSSFPLVGTPGEGQLRIHIDSRNPELKKGDVHSCTLVISSWKQDEKKWSTHYGTSHCAARVEEVKTDEKVWKDHYCAGAVKLYVEAHTDTGAAIAGELNAALLTPHFPK